MGRGEEGRTLYCSARTLSGTEEGTMSNKQTRARCVLRKPESMTLAMRGEAEMENELQRGGEAGAGTVRRGREVSRWL